MGGRESRTDRLVSDSEVLIRRLTDTAAELQKFMRELRDEVDSQRAAGDVEQGGDPR